MEKGDADAQRLMLAFYRVGRSRHAILRDLLSRHEVTPQQFHLLMYIKASGTARVTDLSAMMMVSKPTASRMINTLCDKGVIRKRADEKDRRLVYLDLTPRGRRVVDEKEAKQRELITRALERVPEAEKAVFLRTLERIGGELAAISREETPGTSEGR